MEVTYTYLLALGSLSITAGLRADHKAVPSLGQAGLSGHSIYVPGEVQCSETIVQSAHCSLASFNNVLRGSSHASPWMHTDWLDRSERH